MCALTDNGSKVLKDITFIFTTQKCLSTPFEGDNRCLMSASYI